MATTKAKNTTFKLYRGDTKTWRLEFPYDITGVQFTFTMKEDIDDPNIKAAISIITTVGDNPADDAANGIVHLTVESNQSSKLSVANYKFGIGKIVPDTIPKVTTLVVGKMEVLADVLQN